jgi:hypothetical protein
MRVVGDNRYCTECYITHLHEVIHAERQRRERLRQQAMRALSQIENNYGEYELGEYPAIAECRDILAEALKGDSDGK